MTTNYEYDWNQHQNGQYSHGDTSLHSVHGQIHAGPHSIPAHTDNGLDPNLLNKQNNNATGAFVSAGTAGQQGFDVRSLGLSEQELRETGLHPSFLNTGRQLPLDQYKINYDPNPIIIRKQIPVEMPTYKQQVIVRYLRPPTPPSPGPLIVKEVREPQPAAAPPLVIRTRAPRERTPPPIIIREAPPQLPQVDTNPQYVTRVVRHTESSYLSPPQQQQQYQHYESFGNGTVNYDQFNDLQTGNPYGNGINPFGNQQEPNWVTEVVSDNGTTSAAPPHLLDHIYRAINNQLPRV
jgi:hypothetical protein